jgi:hypothetical protein
LLIELISDSLSFSFSLLILLISSFELSLFISFFNFKIILLNLDGEKVDAPNLILDGKLRV